MIISMDDSGRMSLEGMRAFLAASEPVEFAAEKREQIYQWVERTLREQDYAQLPRADKGLVRRYLGVRKASFGPVETVTALTGMEYGGITPIGLPPEWPVLVDALVAKLGSAVIGSGIRKSKLRLPGRLLGDLPGAEIIPGLGA